MQPPPSPSSKGGSGSVNHGSFSSSHNKRDNMFNSRYDISCQSLLYTLDAILAATLRKLNFELLLPSYEIYFLIFDPKKQNFIAIFGLKYETKPWKTKQQTKIVPIPLESGTFYNKRNTTFTHCQAKCKQMFLWQKGLVGQCWAGLTLNFNFHCLIQ